jgi:ribonucleoside-diphosphate reductase alpha chain
VISKDNLPTFAAEIGFLSEAKQAVLLGRIGAYTRGPYREGFTATFHGLVPEGEELVYDLNEPATHSFVANGIVVHNCGEQGLPAWGVCNLGALNLAAFVKDGTFDYELLADHARTAIRFLDDVVDANDYFIKENREAQLGTRRTGLGTMGLADALLALEVRYGSDESLAIIDRVYSTIRDAAYESSCDIAAEKGPFGNFVGEKYLQGAFIRRLPEPIRTKIGQHGTRNAVILTQAPTGTTSLLAGVSSGIEPVFDFAMVRHVSPRLRGLAEGAPRPANSRLVRQGRRPDARGARSGAGVDPAVYRFQHLQDGERAELPHRGGGRSAVPPGV